MAIELIDKVKQKNNGKFKLMDGQDVEFDGTGKSIDEKIKELEQSGSSPEIITDEEIEALFKQGV